MFHIMNLHVVVLVVLGLLGGLELMAAVLLELRCQRLQLLLRFPPRQSRRRFITTDSVPSTRITESVTQLRQLGKQRIRLRESSPRLQAIFLRRRIIEVMPKRLGKMFYHFIPP